MLCQSEYGLEKRFQTQSIAGGSEFIKNNEHCIYVPQRLYRFKCWWTFRLLPCPSYCIVLQWMLVQVSFSVMIFSDYRPSSEIFGSHGILWGFPGGANCKEPACQCRYIRDAGSVPGSGKSPGGGHGNPLQNACLENPMNRGAWRATVHRVAKSQT